MVGSVTWFDALWHLLGVLAEVGPASLLAGTAAAGLLLAAALALRVLVRCLVAGPGPRITRRILRDRAGCPGVPRHRDPDARGHSRPRAPTAARAAA